MSHMKLDRLEDGRYAARPELCGARLIELTDVSRWADDCLRAPPPSLNGEKELGMTEDRWLTTREAAEVLRISYSYLKQTGNGAAERLSAQTQGAGAVQAVRG